MFSVRMLPPPEVKSQARTVNGRTYAATPGVVVDVPVDSDADSLEANGWSRVARVGTTSGRPPAASVSRGDLFYDKTIGALIVSDGATWRSPVDGSAV